MDMVICGDGRLGWAIASTAHEHGHRARVLGRPGSRHHDATDFARADVMIDASRAEAVPANIEAAIDGGIRRFVIATTGWTATRDDVNALLERRGAAAVVAPNLSLGAAVFLDLVESAAAAFARLDGFEPFIWEWHRRGKADRPSGTARELARRIAVADPASTDVEISAVRAGASPGTHLVGFDASGETIELRLTARDRTSYAAGALAAVGWLTREPRRPGIHGFDAVVADLLHPTPLAATA